MSLEQVPSNTLHNGAMDTNGPVGISKQPVLEAQLNGQEQGRVDSGLGSDLPPLQRAQLTAQAVAHSTGQAVEKLSHHYQQQQHVSSPSQESPQCSSGESVLSSSTSSLTETNKGAPPLANSNGVEGWRVLQKPVAGYPDSFAHSTPLAAVDSQQLHTGPNLAHRAGQLASFSPIEKAMYTAEQVAESTGEAVQKLSKSLSEHKTPPHVQ